MTARVRLALIAIAILPAIGASCWRPRTPANEPEFSALPPELAITPLPDEILSDLPDPDPAPELGETRPARVAAIATGRSPYGIGLSPNGAYLYVANHADGTLSVFSTADHARIAVVPIANDASPYALAVHPGGNKLFVSTFNAGGLAVLEAVRFTAAREPARLGSFTEGVAVTPDGRLVLVTAPLAHKLYLLDAETLAVKAEVAVGKEPHGVAVLPDGRAAYVALGGADAVAVVSLPDGKLVGEPIPVGDSPRAVAISSAGDLLAVASVGDHSLSIVSTLRNEVVARVRVGRQPTGVAFSPYGRYVYVANFGSRSVMAVATQSAMTVGNRDTSNAVRATVKLAAHPWAIAFSGDGRLVYVTGQDRDTVDVIATNGMM